MYVYYMYVYIYIYMYICICIYIYICGRAAGLQGIVSGRRVRGEGIGSRRGPGDVKTWLV